ncbi:L-selectin-like [Onychostoma macrolepis]|uniref:L-selectin-like n=1 Tax=Onychostoma macrolepis TaxID=369639 RepID=UPI0027296088|nr:L-selectin-like [Onychostoma macrolepis]
MNNILLTTSDSVERRLKRTMAGGVVVLKTTSVHIGVLIHLCFILVSVGGWTYEWKADKLMSWNETREWCQQHYTDIAMVHNENVTHFLKENVKNISSPYYWIGMRKISGTWTWVANGQPMKYENWALNEPNNKSNENCVELYTSRTDNSGKWNDDNCQLKKHPLCQKAHCRNHTCADREDCKEQVNSFTCVCKPGFSGPKCETVVSCDPLSVPPYGRMNCSDLFGNHSLKSNCTFSCASGYKLYGTAELKCNSSGVWNAPLPSCAEDCKEQDNNFTSVGKLGFSEPKPETAKCFPILLFGGGLMNCTEGHDSNRSACRVQCPPGHLLLGFVEFTCRADGTWESSFPIMCASYVHFLFALLTSVVISVFCGCLFCCSSCSRSKNAVRLRTQQEMVNPAYEAEHTPLEGPLCSA